MPVYTLFSEENDDGILESFDRAASAQRLDKVIRNYLTNHNAAQEGLIYLVSPYRGVAVFSLSLALLLDIAAFVTGVVIDRVAGANREKSSGKEGGKQDNMAAKKKQDKDYGTVWNIIPGLNRYIYLTGDYMYLDGIITYKIIENGEEAEIEYSDPNLKSGFYQWKDKMICNIEKSDLSFLGVSEEPKDGIYENCAIKCNEGLLILTEGQGNERKSTFLGNVTPYVPIYLLSKDEYEVYPAKDVSDTFGKNIVVALNREGTQIIAIYVISG
ncbi:MAG: hypothetical protein K2L18_01335 [Acetatifactor sp.]|nr:hypothetical protein [Acetatifactor sp.]